MSDIKSEILRIKDTEKGKEYVFKVNGKQIIILFTNHSLERIVKWGLTQENVSNAIFNAEEILRGHNNRFIAHLRVEEHLKKSCLSERPR